MDCGGPSTWAMRGADKNVWPTTISRKHPWWGRQACLAHHDQQEASLVGQAFLPANRAAAHMADKHVWPTTIRRKHPWWGRHSCLPAQWLHTWRTSMSGPPRSAGSIPGGAGIPACQHSASTHGRQECLPHQHQEKPWLVGQAFLPASTVPPQRADRNVCPTLCWPNPRPRTNQSLVLPVSAVA